MHVFLAIFMISLMLESIPLFTKEMQNLVSYTPHFSKISILPKSIIDAVLIYIFTVAIHLFGHTNQP